MALPEISSAPSAAAQAPAPSPSAAPGASSTAVSDPGLLNQTRDVPHASGPAFEARASALWEAIVQDDPDRAMAFFFPLSAYKQVKDVANPAADWKHRLVAAFARDVHALHARLSEGGAQRARFLGLEVADKSARWVEPGEEYNKIGYFRVFGSKLRYELEGVTHTFDVKSLISWRGEWYVVHLSAIQ